MTALNFFLAIINLYLERASASDTCINMVNTGRTSSPKLEHLQAPAPHVLYLSQKNYSSCGVHLEL